jgi:hypothetical protein
MRSRNLPGTDPEKPEPGGTAAGIGAASSMVGLAVTACCAGPLAAFLGPFLVGVLGAAGAATAIRLAPYAPYFFAASLASLAYGFWANYRVRPSCAIETANTKNRRMRFSRVMLWFAAGIFVFSLSYSIVTAGHF